jgi:beta-galactosidase/beta-glucuronidase
VVSAFLPAGASAIVYWHGEMRFDQTFYESAGYFRPVWLSEHERPFLNRTMAIIEREVEKTALRYPGIISAQGLKRME